MANYPNGNLVTSTSQVEQYANQIQIWISQLTCITATKGSDLNGYVKSTAVIRSAPMVMPVTARSFSFKNAITNGCGGQRHVH